MRTRRGRPERWRGTMRELIPSGLGRATRAAATGNIADAMVHLRSMALELEGRRLEAISDLLEALPEHPAFPVLWDALGRIRAIFEGEPAGSGSPTVGGGHRSPVERVPTAAVSSESAANVGSGLDVVVSEPAGALAGGRLDAAVVEGVTAAPLAEPFRWTPPNLGEETLRSYFSEATECLDVVAEQVATAQGGDSDEMAEVYRKLHTVKGSSGMFGLRPVEALVHAMEDLVRALRAGEVPLTDQARLLVARGVVIARQAVCEAQKDQVVVVDHTELAEEIRRFLRDPSGAMSAREPVSHGPVVARPLASHAPVPSAEGSGPGVFAGHAAGSAGHGHGKVVGRSDAQPGEGKGGAVGRSAPGGGGQRAKGLDSMQLRVDFGKVDRLASMVGEQTMQQDEVSRQLLRVQEAIEEMERRLSGIVGGSGEVGAAGDGAMQYLRQATRNLAVLAGTMESKAQQLDLTSTKLHGMVLDLRMTRIGELFQKHSLTVMTAAAAQGKKARLVIEGGETRLDKSIVERLDEPLLHLIRNAVSHGIGRPEVRRAAGKPEEGVVTARAFQRGNHVIVQVEDDGNGIDPEVIRRKAVDKGFLSADEAQGMDDGRVVDLIFAPGFSTTNVVDGISGRGVGLDSVRNEINRVSGAVQLISAPGRGTTFELVLPLTLALSRMLLVEVAGETVAIPSDNVGRVLLLEGERVIRLEGRYLARVEDETIPLVFLDRALGLTTVPVVRSEYTVCVVTHGAQKAGLVVDRTVDYMQAVIRDLGPMLAQVEYCMGVTFFEGACLLIVDPGAVGRAWQEGQLGHGVQSRTARVAVITDTPHRFAAIHALSRRKPIRAIISTPGAFDISTMPKVTEVWVDGNMENLEEQLERLDLGRAPANAYLWISQSVLDRANKGAIYRGGILDLLVGDSVKEFLERVVAVERRED